MIKAVDNARRVQFQQQGWVRLAGLIGDSFLDELETAYDAVIEQILGNRQPTDEVFQYPGASRQSTAVSNYLTRVVGPLGRSLLGCEDVQLLQDALVHKTAGCTGSIPWHQDYSYTAYLDPPATISVRLALSEETVAAGCMNVLEGSHRWPISRPLDIGAQAMTLSAIDYLPDEMAKRLDESTRAVVLRRGEISVHHCKTIHGSMHNQTAYSRKTIVTHVFDSRCVLNKERLPHPDLSSHFKVDGAGHLCSTLFPILRD